MSTSKNFDRLCATVVALSLILTVLFMNGEAWGLNAAERTLGYEDRLFDTSKVHTLALAVDDWDGFLENCENEEYVACSAVIDGESCKNVALRAKGNTSLSSVKSSGSSRYSFKLEFDHYNKNTTYHGLDKLCLNNIIQDKTYMKDYLAYRLMAEFGVDAPLCSYVYITVNGEDWGLYLAVEGVEDSFLKRNYGTEGGDLYKPDSMSMGGGRGNGRDFNMDDILQDLFGEDVDVSTLTEEEIREKLDEARDSMPQGGPGGGFPGGNSGSGGGFPGGNGGPGDSFPGGGQTDAGSTAPPDGMPAGESDGASETAEQGPGGDAPSAMEAAGDSEGSTASEAGSASEGGPGGSGGFPGGGFPGGNGGGPGGGFPGGMGSSDVKLQYTDEDPDSYSAIFGNAKTTVTDADKARLIASIKQLSEQENLDEVLDIDEVLWYFAVHNFLVNGDSYTGTMIHNYYLYEAGGKLSMIPWDYNLAYGSFQGNDASSAVNDPIDTPLSVGSGDSRPMADWIFASEEYTARYHELLGELLESFDLAAMAAETAEMIAPYVEKDPTKFCTYEDFEQGTEAMRLFLTLRSESVRGQLDGTIPSTDEGQSADSSALVDASALNTSDLGTMGGGGGPGGSDENGGPGGGFHGGSGGGRHGGNGGRPGGSTSETGTADGEASTAQEMPAPPQDGSEQPAESGTEQGGGGRPEGGGFSGPGSMPFSGGTPSGETAGSALTQQDWLMLGACFAALALGILFTKRYRVTK